MPGPDLEARDAAGLKGASTITVLVPLCRFLLPSPLASQQYSDLLSSVPECKCLPYTYDNRVTGMVSVEALLVGVISERT